MPMVLAPPKGAKVPTKPVTPSGWYSEGPLEEHFDILVYFFPENERAAMEAGTKTINEQGKPAREEIDWDVVNEHLIMLQCKNWKVIAPNENPGWVERFEERTELHDVKDYGKLRYWKFTPENLEHITWDMRRWLLAEIRACGGGMATENLIVKTKSGKKSLDFRGALGVVHDKQAPEGVPTPG